MMRSERFCQLQGHEQHKSTLICTFLNCTEATKWVCPECLRKQIHQHGQLSNDHLMNQKEFLEFIDYNNQGNLIDQCKSQLNTLQKSINQFQQHLKNNYEIKNLIDIVKQDFFSLSDEQLAIAQNYQIQKHQQINQNFLDIIKQAKDFEQLLDIKKFTIPTVLQVKNNPISLTQNISKSVIQKNNFYNQIDNNIASQQIQLSQLKPSVNRIKILNSNFEYENYIQLFKTTSLYIRYAQISQNEKYLALCQDNKLIIHNLEEKSLLKEITLQKDSYYCLFNQNSTIIYIGCNDGLLYCIELDDFFKQLTIFHEEVQLFNYFVDKASYKILYGWGRNIYEIDFKKQSIDRQVENAHSDNIVQIQYDKINKIIVSCSNDKSIKFFQEQGDIIINHEQAHQSKFRQIQLINNNQQLLSLCINGILSLWQISLENRQIQLIDQINREPKTLSFNSVYNDKYIIIQSVYNLELIDAKFKYIKQISSSQKDQIRDSANVKQINSMNYLIILRYSEVTIMKQLKRQDNHK